MQNLHVSEQTAMFSGLMVLTDFEATEKLPNCLKHFNKCTAFFNKKKKNQSQCKQNRFYIVFIDSSSKVNKPSQKLLTFEETYITV